MSWASSASAIQLALLLPATVVAVDAIRRLVRDRTERNGYPLPPGPSAVPLLGSVLSVNTEEPWITYTEWRAKYGGVMYVRLLDLDVIILNSFADATELLEKRSQIYSDRPFIATIEPYGHGNNFSLARYGERWRMCRRIFHQTFRAQASLSFRPMQLRMARQMILNIMEDPQDYPSHFATFSAAIAVSAVYDYEPSPRNDPIVSILDRFVELSIPALMPEKAVLIKALPFLLHIPDWLPGSSIKRTANDAYAWGVKTLEVPYEYVTKRMEAKEHINSTMVFDHITRMNKLDLTDSSRSDYTTALKQAAVTAFLGSAETTSSSLMVFTLAMIQHPQVLKRAQAEIEAVVGTDRLPDFDDRPSMPYVDAIMRETMRWQPVVPLIPHATTNSDIYKDFYIPKGTSHMGEIRSFNGTYLTLTGAMIIGNIWAMSRDETRYPDPEKFIPERFLDAQGALIDDNPSDFVFGFGRRICPGRHTADASVWTGIVTMLATLDFNLAKDANGKDMTFQAKYQNGITRHPLKFPCRLSLRSHISKEFLERVLAR